MIAAGMAFGRLVALAFGGAAMEQDRALQGQRPSQARAEFLYVMTVHHTHVREAQFLEQHAGHQDRLEAVLQLASHRGHALPHSGKALHVALQIVAEAGELGVEAQARQIGAHGSHIALDGHGVVVEHHEQRAAEVAGMIEGLVGHAAGEGAVTDDCHDASGAALRGRRRILFSGRRRGLTPPRLHDTQRRADGGAAVTCAVGVEGALAAAGEPGEAAVSADGVEGVQSAREQLVRVGLVTHVPDDGVVGGVQLRVESDGQLHRSQTGTEVTAVAADGGDYLIPHFFGNLAERLRIQCAQGLG